MRSEAQWAKSNEQLLERMRSEVMPPIFIDGKNWADWEPKLIQ